MSVKGILSLPFVLLYMIISFGSYIIHPVKIDTVCVHYNSFGQIYLEYKVDLKNKELWKYDGGMYKNYTARDKDAEHEGYTFVRDLDSGAVAKFRRQARRGGLSLWRDKYEPRRGDVIVEDYWFVTLLRSDGSERSSYGNGTNLPLTWDRMYAAFEELTGEQVLQYKNGWWKQQ